MRNIGVLWEIYIYLKIQENDTIKMDVNANERGKQMLRDVGLS